MKNLLDVILNMVVPATPQGAVAVAAAAPEWVVESGDDPAEIAPSNVAVAAADLPAGKMRRGKLPEPDLASPPTPAGDAPEIFRAALWPLLGEKLPDLFQRIRAAVEAHRQLESEVEPLLQLGRNKFRDQQFAKIGEAGSAAEVWANAAKLASLGNDAESGRLQLGVCRFLQVQFTARFDPLLEELKAKAVPIIDGLRSDAERREDAAARVAKEQLGQAAPTLTPLTERVDQLEAAVAHVVDSYAKAKNCPTGTSPILPAAGLFSA